MDLAKFAAGITERCMDTETHRPADPWFLTVTGMMMRDVMSMAMMGMIF